MLRPRALACGRPLLGSGLRVQLKRLDRVQMEFVSSKGRASSVRGRTVVVQAKKQQFRAPRFGEQPWQYALSMAEDALEVRNHRANCRRAANSSAPCLLQHTPP